MVTKVNETLFYITRDELVGKVSDEPFIQKLKTNTPQIIINKDSIESNLISQEIELKNFQNIKVNNVNVFIKDVNLIILSEDYISYFTDDYNFIVYINKNTIVNYFKLAKMFTNVNERFLIKVEDLV